MRVRAFLVRLPSGPRYWTVLDENLAVVGEADVFLRHVRFGLGDWAAYAADVARSQQHNPDNS